MDRILEVPLFRNSNEDIHCVQASLQMVLKYFFPDRDYPLSYLDRVTYHCVGGWTWNTSVFAFLSLLGLEMVVIDEFDLRRFGEEGIEYLCSIWTHERLRLEALNADLEFEQMLARDLMTTGFGGKVRFQNRRGSKQDIIDFFVQEYLVVASVNAYRLDDEEGFCGHYVVITGKGDELITFNDPGLPAIKNRMVSWPRFEDARSENPNLFAVRRHQVSGISFWQESP